MDRDYSEALLESVLQAVAAGQHLTVVGSGSKSFLLPRASVERSRMLSLSEHQGIVEYRPDELVLTARAGTRLKEIRQVLAAQNQMLPFEPPEYRAGGTLGGAVACGLSGPARPWRGSLRDALLGVRLINGYGEALRFGGQVVKNVAGYDVSRLQAGAFGTLGVLLEISIRVVPMPSSSQTRVLALSAADGLAKMRQLARQALPITGACHVADRLYLRLEGAEAAVLSAAAEVGGDVEHGFWSRLNNQELEFFHQPGVLVRQQLAPAEALPSPWQGLIDWAGARRWQVLAADQQPAAGWIPFDHQFARFMCRQAGGDTVLSDYQARIRNAFDPQSLFNPELSDADISA